MKKSLYIIFIIILLTGCATKKKVYKYYENRSSLVNYLYPQKEHKSMEFWTTKLKIPIKIGIGFIPSKKFYYQRIIDEKSRVGLLKKIQRNLKKHKFIKESKIIPSAFFEKGGGFEDLEKIKKLYDVDLIALVSYDVIQFRVDSFHSLRYWTIIGTDIIKAKGNLIHSMINFTLIESKNKKLLFKALGINRLINSENLVADRKKSFQKASKNLIKNINRQLPIFKWRMKEK